MTWQSVEIWLKSKSHSITANKLARIQKTIDSNEALHSNEALPATFIGGLFMTKYNFLEGGGMGVLENVLIFPGPHP